MQSNALIYIADDDPIARLSVQALLEDQAYDLVFFNDGFTLLNALTSEQPDLILLDVMMPGITGFEVCERIRSSPMLDGIPVFLITALDGQDDKIRGIQAGADDFVTKPFDRVELQARIKMVTHLNRYRRIITAERRLMWVVDAAPEGYLIVDEQDQIRYANRMACQYLNLDHSTPVVKTAFKEILSRQYSLVPESNWENWPAGLHETDTVRYIVRPETLDFNAQWLKVDVLSTMNPSDPAYLLRLRDISAQMQTQMEQFSFHSAINHKLRTPLGQIIGGLELLHANASSVSNELGEMSKWALRGANQLSSQIKEILSYARLSSTGINNAGACLPILLTLIPKIQTDLELKPGDLYLEPTLYEHSTLLSEKALDLILRELHENAVKFHPMHDPKMVINIRKLSNTFASIEVISDGKPMSATALSRAWEPYFQNEKSYSGQVPGMGLGLAMVASLVWQNGGNCNIQNLPDDAGVKITLNVPIRQS
jgi:DNA-binding response OmpR family regulator/signal transduction histidine kinase